MSAMDTCESCGWGMIPRHRWKKMPIEARQQALENNVRDKYRNGQCRTCYQRQGHIPRGPSVAEIAANRLEDLRWMAETGEHLDGAARRLDMTPGNLRRFLARHDRELYDTLAARNPRDHNGQPDGSGVMAFSDNEARRARQERHNAARRAKRTVAA